MAKKFKLVKNFRGYRNKRDKTNLPEVLNRQRVGFLVEGSQNVFINDAEKIAIRPGFSLDGATNTATDPVESSFDWNTSSGTERNLRAYSDELEVRISGTWTSILDSWASVAFNFTTYWDTNEVIDILLFVNGDDVVYAWSGGLALISATTSNTIKKTGTTTWAEERFITSGSDYDKKVYINGTVYTYTGGETTTTLTGVSPNPTGEADGSNVISSITSFANIPASDADVDLIGTLKNQVYYGNTTRNDVYISKVNDFNDVSFTATRKPGEGALIRLDGSIVAFIPQEDSMYVSAGKDQWYKTNFTLGSDITVEDLSIIPLKTGAQQAAQSQALITKIKNNVAFVSNEPTLDTLGRVENITTAEQKPLSDPIKTDFDDNIDFTNGDLAYYRNRIYLAEPTNDRVWIFDVERGFWYPPWTIPIRRFAIIGGLLYGHSSRVPETYKLLDGIRDRGGTSSTSEGPNSPGTMANDDSIGTEPWSNPDNAKTSDDVRALAGIDDATVYYLKATNFGFAIPSGATINGILVEVEKKSLNSLATDNAVRIVKGGIIGSTDKSSVSVWANSDAYVEHGGSTDLWGETWASSDINSSTFGFAISVKEALDAAFIDHIRITVYYTDNLRYSLNAIAKFNYQNFGDRINLKLFDEFYVEGSIATNTTLTLKLNYEFDGAESIQSFNIDGSDDTKIFKLKDDGSLGKKSLGKKSLGSIIISPTNLPKFRTIETTVPKDFHEVQVVYESSGTDLNWEVLSFGPNIRLSKAQPISIKS